MIVTCPACGRKAAVAEDAREVVCDCGRRFDPAERPTVADPFLGHDVGGYRIEEILGSGGMGTVYRATQLSLGRSVALKVLPPNVADHPQFVGRFHREAEILASLSHPHIVQVIDRGESDGRYFIVMEYVDGENLRQLLKRGPVPQKQACRIVAALLGALDYAHSRGVIHRDIKPENILVREDGVVKVADFGLSRVLGGEETDTRLTRTHLVLGTYEYMAPEQRESVKEADSRSDIFATAVVLYEMLTGELPIGRFDLPSERVPGLDRRIDAVVAKGLAKDPDARFARASAMGHALESLVSSPEAPVDLDAVRLGANRLARTVTDSAREVMGRLKDTTWRPSTFEMKLDVVLTVLAVLGIVLTVTGVVFLFAGGLFLVIYGALLWNAAERARKFWPGARTMLLVLTAIAGVTLVLLPLTIWTWRVFLGREMRLYYDARHRGLDAREAATVAHGYPLSEMRANAIARRGRAAQRTIRIGRWAALLAILCGIGWALTDFSDRDEGVFFVSSGAVLMTFSVLLLWLGGQVRAGYSLRFHACLWWFLGILSPAAGREARMLVRDQRDELV